MNENNDAQELDTISAEDIAFYESRLADMKRNPEFSISLEELETRLKRRFGDQIS